MARIGRAVFTTALIVLPSVVAAEEGVAGRCDCYQIGDYPGFPHCSSPTITAIESDEWFTFEWAGNISSFRIENVFDQATDAWRRDFDGDYIEPCPSSS